MRRLYFSLILSLLVLLLTGAQVSAQEDLIPYEGNANGDGAELAEDTEFEEIPGPIEDMTAGWEVTDGLYRYYRDEVSRRVLIELREDQLDHEILISSTLSKGTGDEVFAAPMLWSDSLIEFRRDGATIELVYPNTQISTVAGEPMALAVENGISDLIFGRVPIEAENEDGRLVFDLPMVLSSFTSLEMIGYYYGYSWTVDYEGSYIEQIKGFPLNDEIDARMVLYGAGTAASAYVMEAQELGWHYSLSEPPPPGYVPRLADDRVGYFQDISMMYSVETDRAESRLVRYINRWRLEKQDPDAVISDPVEPIVFWIENTVPHEYRSAVRTGIEFWQPAFERAGFSNAIIAKQMPDDADWDPADIRYNTIRWFISPSVVYSIGPSRTDPRTGEIYDADIGMNADMLPGPYLNYELSVDPLRKALQYGAPPGWQDLNGMQVPWNDDTNAIINEQTQRMMQRDELSSIQAFEAARVGEFFRIRDDLDLNSEEVNQYIDDYIIALVAHEVGHTLGLKHNFAASSATSYWRLNQRMYTSQHGLSSSIMDYTTINIAAPGQPQGEYFQTSPGDYDYYAIEYGYTPLGAETPSDELEGLNELAGRAPNYRIAYDEDYYGWTRNMDPDTNIWDLSDDSIRFYRDRLLASDAIIEQILDYYSGPGNRPARIRLSFIYAFWEYIQAGRAVPRLIGGVRQYRDHVGDPGAHRANVPVSAEDQRRCLEFLRDYIWSSDHYQFDPELLTMLGKERQQTMNYSDLVMGTLDFDIHTYVLIAQEAPFMWIYDPLVLQRVQNNEIRMLEDEEVFTMVELFDTIRGSIWTELIDNSPVDSFRRNLQRSHLQMIAGIVLRPAVGTPDDAVALARRDLMILKQTIEDLLYTDAVVGMDTMTNAHLTECLAKIDQALEAPASTGGSITFMF